MSKPSLQDWVWIEVMFIQAMVGAITQNFREVALKLEEDTWKLEVVLDVDEPDDIEEVHEIVDSAAVFISEIKEVISKDANLYIDSEIIIGKRPWLPAGGSRRILYRRKE